jgi:hypothetical protein
VEVQAQAPGVVDVLGERGPAEHSHMDCEHYQVPLTVYLERHIVKVFWLPACYELEGHRHSE